MSAFLQFEEALRAFQSFANRNNLRFAIIGGVATILNGVDRRTQDINVALWVETAEVEKTIRNLLASGFRSRVENPESFARVNRMALLEVGGVEVDVSLALLPFEEGFINQAQMLELTPELTVPIASPESLIAMKLVAHRPQDVLDAVKLLELFPTLNKRSILENVVEFGMALENPEMIESSRKILGFI